MYRWHQIRVMRENGKSIKKITRELRISKNTVRKYLRSADPPMFKARAYEEKLDLYQDQMTQMLKKGYIGTRIFNELREMGYTGSLATVHRYIHRWKEAQALQKSLTTRFETPPGHQMQYDWKEWMLPVGERQLKIYLHEVVLSYSRLKHYSVSLSIGAQDVMRAIEAAIWFFGGTARELLIDNPKQMVLTHRRNGVVHYSDAFLKFCGLYGIEPHACRPYRARTKGKAERPFYYLQEHLLRGLAVGSLEEFDPKLADFTKQYNQRPHSTLGESPLVRFAQEKGYLKPVPAVEPTLLYEREMRQVSSDGYISYRGGFYAVPMRLCGQQVWIECVGGRTLRVYDKTGLMASEQTMHLFEPGQRPLHPEHEEINQEYGRKKEAFRSALVRKFVSLFGTIGQEYLAGLRSSVGANVYWHLSEILACCELYEAAEVARALQACVRIGSYHKNTVLRLLDPSKLLGPASPSTSAFGRWPRQELSRPLSAYALLWEVDHE